MTYDYVVVGAGAAGCVLAARLSEDEGCTVALVEAGHGSDIPEIRVPALATANFKSRHDWDDATDLEPELGGRRVYLPHGRCLGGSTCMNVMVYIRGNRADYDEWAALGLEGWGYADVLPYFRRAEDNERGADAFHGTGGPLSVSDGRSRQPLVDTWIEAAQQAGHAVNPDFNGAEQEGVGHFQVMQRAGWRWTAATGYLAPALERPNLTVLSGALATRVVLEGDRAAGVELLRGDDLEVVRAGREVIVSAGGYNSPKLLLLSGIGPQAELRRHLIEQRAELPVGEGLQDHIMCFASWFVDAPSLRTAFTAEAVALHASEGRGPMATNGPEGGGFLRTRPDLALPDVQFHTSAGRMVDEGLGLPLDDDVVSFGPMLLRGLSRGRVTLRSAMPHTKPRIQHNYISEEQDRRSMVDGLRLAMEMADQPALRAVRRPGAQDMAPASTSDEDVLAFLRRNGQTTYHPSGACAMGAVVDAELCVLGIDGLRVVDASVMPLVPRGNTTAPTIMVAEKAADLIRGIPAPLPADLAAASAPA